MKTELEKIAGIELEKKDGKLYYSGYLYLEGTQITSLPENLTVGGYLDLEGTHITSLPDNLTVGGYLDLEGTQITSLPENLTVGGALYLEGTQITDTSKVNRNAPTLYTWRDKKYIKVDDIFSVVVSHRGNVYRVSQIGKTEITYLVTNGKGKFAHGKTIDEARKDLIYKIADRDKSEYETLALDSEVTFEEAIEMYRVITGACSFGTRNFVENRLKVKKGKYTISEIIEITRGEYGNTVIAEFFKNN